MVQNIILPQIASAQNKKNIMKVANDCLEIMKGDHDCFNPMVQNSILPQNSSAQHKKKTLRREATIVWKLRREATMV